MDLRKPSRKNIKEFYAGEFSSSVDEKNRIFLPRVLGDTLVFKNNQASSEDLETIILCPKKDRIECYDMNYRLENHERLDHRSIYITRLGPQNRVLIPFEISSKYAFSKRVLIYASKKGDYFIIKNEEKKK